MWPSLKRKIKPQVGLLLLTLEGATKKVIQNRLTFRPCIRNHVTDSITWAWSISRLYGANILSIFPNSFDFVFFEVFRGFFRGLIFFSEREIFLDQVHD